ncbi:MAG: PEP-CTERM sorting domain-containing protein [Planctomycetota bacterium]
MKRLLLALPCLLGMASASTASPPNASTLTFDENAFPTNALNGFGGFTFEDFGSPGAVTVGPTSITLDITDDGGNVGVFGGAGVDFVVETSPGSGDFVPQDFDITGARWEMRVKLLPGNEATGINTTFIDDDGAGSGDEHQYNFDLTGVPNDGEFHILTALVSSPGFTQGAFGLTAGDTLVNPGLRQIQVQSQFGSTGRLNVEIDFVRIVPEPASAALLLLAMGTVAGRRRSAA